MCELTLEQARITDISPGRRLLAVRDQVERYAKARPITTQARERAVHVAECVFQSTGYADKAIRAGKNYVRFAVEKGGTGITPPKVPA